MRSWCVLVGSWAASAAEEAGWQQLADGPWSAREGLMAATTPEGILMTGGRDFFGAKASADVWFSANGSRWEKRPAAPFPARAYHATFYKDGCVLVMGGQKVSFVGNPFFNDVWKSCDNGETWQSLGNAPWQTRAGIAFAEFQGRMVVAGGCYGESIGKSRKFLNDVWASDDGTTWTQLTASAPWEARSGARLVAFQDKLYLIAGERGFTPDTQFGDIWESTDGKDWTLVTTAPGWTKRSGHGVLVANGELVVIAGWHDNKCLHDLWTSADARTWKMVSNSTWNCDADSCGKFDFWPVLTNSGELLTLGGSNAYSTFGKLWADTWQLPLSSLNPEPGNVLV